ncbi:MAG: helix-turn-helix domain-containing protein [Candidatus Hodarchaeota archaeon]
MSIFSKQVEDIVFEDIQELLAQRVQENIRLEYKKELPPKKDKDELVKKLSSMSNTYGGYIIIGMEEDGHGNPLSICGVSQKKGFKQQVVQWCYQEVYPPITPFVSNPIPNETANNTVIYVVYVDMSLDAPHFLTTRRGCYIRTDEYSQKFEPRLATYEEIKFLSDRRKQGDDKRTYLVERSKRRFDQYCNWKYQDFSIKSKCHPELQHLNRASFLYINLIPQFPHARYKTEHELLQLIPKIQLPPTKRLECFPSEPMYSQFESVIFPYPRAMSAFSYMELNTYGQLCYYSQIAEVIHKERMQKIIDLKKVGSSLFHVGKSNLSLPAKR